jgi:tetratricopeptide (TPR) repeat protein
MSIALGRHPFDGYRKLFGSIGLGLAAVFLCNYCWLSTSLRENQADYFLRLGHFYKERGWTEKARHALEVAVRLAPTSEPGKYAALYLKARIPKEPISEEAEQANITAFNLHYAGHQQEAVTAYKKTIAAYPNFEWPYGNLACIYIEQGRYKEAIPLLKKALEINPNYANGWKNLASAYDCQGDHTSARECLKKLDKLLPSELSGPR